MTAADFLMLDAVPMLIGVLASVACALPGNFLLLRRQALIGDAISHVVLPGIVAAFILTGLKSAWPMMLGAGAAALVAVGLIEAVRRLGRLESGAAMGVVFTTMFAAGVLALELTDTAGVHLDVDHALNGNLESLIWLEGAAGWGALTDPAALAGLPDALGRLALVLIAIGALMALFWKELAIATFDPGFAATAGIPVGAMSVGLVVVTAVAAVAAFDAVGSIIVIAMFICPPAAARLMTDRLGVQVASSMGFAAVSAVVGCLVAAHLPPLIGLGAVSAAGMIATVSGLLLGIACLAAPRRRADAHGVALG
ncbi:MAG: metal ABC transporter permease [Pseudomonadota bacterium]